jgi:hypothetical protein
MECIAVGMYTVIYRCRAAAMQYSQINCVRLIEDIPAGMNELWGLGPTYGTTCVFRGLDLCGARRDRK